MRYVQNVDLAHCKRKDQEHGCVSACLFLGVVSVFVLVFERTSSPRAGAHVHGDDDGLPCAVAHAPDENEDAHPCAAAHALGENEDSLPCAVAHAHDDDDGTLNLPLQKSSCSALCCSPGT